MILDVTHTALAFSHLSGEGPDSTPYRDLRRTEPASPCDKRIDLIVMAAGKRQESATNASSQGASFGRQDERPRTGDLRNEAATALSRSVSQRKTLVKKPRKT